MEPKCGANVAAGETCEVQLTVLVDGGPDGPAAGLQGPGAGAGASPLDSIVILRIEDSGDKFVTISGELACSSTLPCNYAFSVSWLTACIPAWYKQLACPLQYTALRGATSRVMGIACLQAATALPSRACC